MALEEILVYATTTSNIVCYLPPLLASVKYYKAGTTGKEASLPLVTSVTSSLLWFLYGVLAKNSMLIKLNLFALLLFVAYLVVFFVYCPERSGLYNEGWWVSVGCLVFLPTVLSVGFASWHSAMLVMGVFCNILTICVYASPLGTLMEVIKQQNTSTMSPPLVCANLFSAVVWNMYGIIVNDIFIMVPNSLGLVLCLGQCALLLKYPRSPAQKTKTS